jgi:hypothetical protein
MRLLDVCAKLVCKREQRYVGAQLSFSFERKKIMLVETGVSRGLAGKYIETYAFADGSLDVRWKGHSLPYTVFDKDQRMTHTAITENKRLGDVLEFIRERQDHMRPSKVKTNSEKVGYKSRGAKPGPRTDFMNDPEIIARRQRASKRIEAAE